MKPVHALVLMVLMCTVFSCKKKSNTITITGNYMIIGHNGGFVAINPPYYLLTTTALLKDTTQYYGAIPDDVSKFHFNITAPAAQYDSVKYLLNDIPSELFNENHADIGSIFPDFGYEDVRTSVNGVLYQWSFQGDQSASSHQIQQFITTLNSDF